LGQTVTGGHGVVGNLLPIAHPANTSLIAGMGTAAAVYAAAAATSSRPSSSRPSTASSSQALGPLVSPAKSQGGYPPGLQTLGYGQAHAGPSSPPNSSVSSVFPSVGASSHQQQQQQQATNSNDYEYQRYAGIGSASSSSSMGGAASSSSQEEAPLYDEQGRPLNMPPEKAPLVHLDGTLYQQPPSGSRAPPAYIE